MHGFAPHWAKAQRVLPSPLSTLEEEVLGRVRVECGREEVNEKEKQEKDTTRTQPTDNQKHIVDGMKME